MNRAAPAPRVGIVGHGHVGKSMSTLFPSAVIYDPHQPPHAGTKDQMAGLDVVFVCVPTPMSEDGTADLTAVAEVIGWLDVGVIVIKSTVPPGSTSKLRADSGKRVVFCPEYLGESRFHHQFTHPADWPFVIVGGPVADTRPVIDLFAAVLGPDKTYRQVEAETAELAKYMENTWLACQVLFAAQFGVLAEALGVDYWELRELWALDPRVSRWHTALFVGQPGFGGKCLPKDVAAIREAGLAAGANVDFITAMISFNRMLTFSQASQECCDD